MLSFAPSAQANVLAYETVTIGVITGTSYGEQFDAAVRNGVLRNVEQTNSIESNLKKLVFGRVVPSYRYVALDTARRLQLLAQIRELSPPLDFGMGLSISQSIVEAHGGRMWVEPNAPHGAVFRFSLPIETTGEGDP